MPWYGVVVLIAWGAMMMAIFVRLLSEEQLRAAGLQAKLDSIHADHVRAGKQAYKPDPRLAAQIVANMKIEAPIQIRPRTEIVKDVIATRKRRSIRIANVA